jgi:hypothetical protein
MNDPNRKKLEIIIGYEFVDKELGSSTLQAALVHGTAMFDACKRVAMLGDPVMATVFTYELVSRKWPRSKLSRV